MASFSRCSPKRSEILVGLLDWTERPLLSSRRAIERADPRASRSMKQTPMHCHTWTRHSTLRTATGFSCTSMIHQQRWRRCGVSFVLVDASS